MAIKPLNGKMVLPRQLTPLVAPPTAPRAKNLGMIFKKSIANQYQIPSEVEKPKKKHFWLMSHFSAFRQVVGACYAQRRPLHNSILPPKK